MLLHDTRPAGKINAALHEFGQKNQAGGNNSDSPLHIVTYFRFQTKRHQLKISMIKSFQENTFVIT